MIPIGYYSLMRGLAASLISMRYPKVSGTKSKGCDKGYINPDVVASLSQPQKAHFGINKALISPV
jgi:hypothetical protein